MSATWVSRSRVFVDTSAYFTIANAHDDQHRAMSELLRELVAARRRFITTNFVLTEVHALLLNRVNRHIALRALDEIEASQLTAVVRVSRHDEQRAREILRQYSDKDFSLVDATSFVVMERLGISQVFTLDHNFAQYGWELIRPLAGEQR